MALLLRPCTSYKSNYTFILVQLFQLFVWPSLLRITHDSHKLIKCDFYLLSLFVVVALSLSHFPTLNTGDNTSLVLVLSQSQENQTISFVP